MVTESVIETTTTDGDNHESNNGGSRMSILNKIKRKPNATQPAALPVVTDGVFSNLSAKPDTEADKEDENPPVFKIFLNFNSMIIHLFLSFINIRFVFILSHMKQPRLTQHHRIGKQLSLPQV